MAKKALITKEPALNKPTEILSTILPTELQVNEESRQGLIATCDKVGLTREKCVQAINDSLTATKMTLDKYGDEHEEPDHDKRLKGALAGLELRGDFKSKSVVNNTSNHTQVVYQWKTDQVVVNGD